MSLLEGASRRMRRRPRTLPLLRACGALAASQPRAHQRAAPAHWLLGQGSAARWHSGQAADLLAHTLHAAPIAQGGAVQPGQRAADVLRSGLGQGAAQRRRGAKAKGRSSCGQAAQAWQARESRPHVPCLEGEAWARGLQAARAWCTADGVQNEARADQRQPPTRGGCVAAGRLACSVPGWLAELPACWPGSPPVARLPCVPSINRPAFQPVSLLHAISAARTPCACMPPCQAACFPSRTPAPMCAGLHAPSKTNACPCSSPARAATTTTRTLAASGRTARVTRARCAATPTSRTSSGSPATSATGGSAAAAPR